MILAAVVLPTAINSCMNNLREIITLIESKEKGSLELETLPYSRTELDPVMSESTLDYHYGKLAKGYVERFNSGEGDADFNEAGAFLHNIFFPQLQTPKNGNKPHGASEALINRRYGSFKEFQEKITETAMGIQGSGWVYMARNGDIKTIKNHQIKKDIALLIDWWEHAWALDYQSNKSKYLKNIWRAINWEYVNRRIYSTP
jgi:Fe-Mn family superoxide dismutase